MGHHIRPNLWANPTNQHGVITQNLKQISPRTQSHTLVLNISRSSIWVGE